MEKDWENLLFDVRRSIRYHSKRAAYYGSLTKSVTALSLILGSGTVAVAVQHHTILSMIFGGIISIASIFALVFGFSSKEHLHTELGRKFADLEKSMVRQKAPNEDFLREKTAERLEIEAGEPETVKTLDLVCHNELLMSQGYGHLVKIGWIRSLFYQFDLPFLKIEFEERNISEMFEKRQVAEKTGFIASPA